VKRIALILVLLCSFQSYSQSYGNEWIQYDQQYFQFDVIEDGVHQIAYGDLIDAGIPVTSIDPRNIQIFAKEKEIPILISGEEDGVFDENEFIEFVAFHNDGQLDSLLYLNPEDYHNPHYSIFNDTLRYFITWNDEVDNKRMTEITDSNFGDYSSIPFVWTTSLHIMPSFYWEGRVINQSFFSPFYSNLEGWFSNFYGYPGSAASYQTNLDNPLIASGPGIPDAILKSVSSSANNAISNGDPNHHLQVSYGDNNLLLDTVFEGYQINKLEMAVDADQLTTGSTLITHDVIDDLDIVTDHQILAWQSLKYPHQLKPNDESEFYFEVPRNGSDEFQYLHFDDAFNDQGIIYVYGEEGYKIPPFFSGDLMDVLIPNMPNQDTKCVLTYPENVHVVGDIKPVTLSGQFTDFGSMTLDSTFVIITHSSLLGLIITTLA